MSLDIHCLLHVGIQLKVAIPQPLRPKALSWLAPFPGSYKLNVDVSSLRNPGNVGGVGVIHNNNGEGSSCDLNRTNFAVMINMDFLWRSMLVRKARANTSDDKHGFFVEIYVGVQGPGQYEACVYCNTFVTVCHCHEKVALRSYDNVGLA
ncbi:hypothetical protein ACH5RR_032554 [Cinchona calisaya]|uniref:Uncharacterized protein n=1 Tax=Cinchona calisaya TaxID=153742 RepID=A0ABD2YLK6_9GENT